MKISYLYIFLLVIALGSCGKYNKLLKSTDLDKKLEMAIQYYDKGDFVRAQTLFDELIGLFRGTDKAEKVFYYHAFNNYELEDYVTASYYFKNFVKNFPTSSKAEECAYMNAYCYYLSSPVYSLDQTDTKTAIRELQSFIDRYPQSERLGKCNEMIDKLREKLERKSYETAKQYYHTTDYKAAIVAFNNVLKDFPGSKYSEELYYLSVKSYYLLAENSIESKKPERLKSCIESYLKLVDTYPKSVYLKDAEDIYNSALKMRAKIAEKP